MFKKFVVLTIIVGILTGVLGCEGGCSDSTEPEKTSSLTSLTV